MKFQRATKTQAKLRLCLAGQSGAGKTWTALSIAEGLSEGGKIAVIDTERSSAALYADRFTFDSVCLDSFSPSDYVDAIELAEQEGYHTIVIDSLSHAWMGKNGALEQVDKIAKREGKSSNFTAWRDVTPLHNKLVDAMLASKCHIIATLRSKTEYVMDKDEKGRTTIRKVGLEPIQRSGIEYEFTIVGDLDQSHQLTITKSRCSAIEVGGVIDRPGEKFAKTLREWLNAGAVPSVRVEAPVTPTPVAAALDDTFAKYLTDMKAAATVADLDRVATGPGRPAKGSAQYGQAIDAYKARRAEIEQAQGAA